MCVYATMCVCERVCVESITYTLACWNRSQISLRCLCVFVCVCVRVCVWSLSHILWPGWNRSQISLRCLCVCVCHYVCVCGVWCVVWSLSHILWPGYYRCWSVHYEPSVSTSWTTVQWLTTARMTPTMSPEKSPSENISIRPTYLSLVARLPPGGP